MTTKAPAANKRYWLMKTEPDCFSFDDLKKSRNQTTYWDGVRNYQARNFLRDDVKKGDGVLFYHSNCDPPAIVGIAEVVKEGYPDHTAFDPEHEHYDPKSKKDNPAWYMVDIKAVKRLKRPVSLHELYDVKALQKMPLLNKSRLSVQPVSEKEWQTIIDQSEK